LLNQEIANGITVGKTHKRSRERGHCPSKGRAPFFMEAAQEEASHPRHAGKRKTNQEESMNNINLALLIFTLFVIAAGIDITRRINKPTSHYQEALDYLLAPGKTNPALRVYQVAVWAQAHDISFDNLPTEMQLPSHARDLFNAAVSMLELGMQADFDKHMSKHRQNSGGF
jgi:hypothetical protein